MCVKEFWTKLRNWFDEISRQSWWICSIIFSLVVASCFLIGFSVAIVEPVIKIYSTSKLNVGLLVDTSAL